MSTNLITTICYGIIGLFGLCGNILVIWTLCKGRRRLQTNYYRLVFHLAICDITLLLIGNAFFTVEPWLEKQFWFSEIRMISCIIVFPLLSCIYTTVLALLVVIAILRHKAITRPFEPSLTARKLRYVIILVYITPLFLHVPQFFSQQYVDKLCINKWSSSIFYHVYSWTIDLGIIFIAMIFLLVLYTKMCYAMALHQKNIRTLFSPQITRPGRTPEIDHVNKVANYFRVGKNAKMIIVSVIVLAQFFIAVLPIRVLGKIVAHGSKEDEFHMRWMLPLYFLVSCSFNPIVYAFGDKTILEGYKTVLSNLFSCK